MSKRALCKSSWQATKNQAANQDLALAAPSVVGFAIEANGGDLEKARAFVDRVVAIFDEVAAEARDEVADTQRPRVAASR